MAIKCRKVYASVFTGTSVRGCKSDGKQFLNFQRVTLPGNLKEFVHIK